MVSAIAISCSSTLKTSTFAQGMRFQSINKSSSFVPRYRNVQAQTFVRGFNSSRPLLKEAGVVDRFKKAYENSSSSRKQLIHQFGIAAIAGVVYGLFVSLGGRKLILNEASVKHAEVSEPVSQVAFPAEVQLSSDGKQYRLVALGPRCVTFLRFTAYAIALYFNKDDLNALLADKTWKDLFQSEKFLADGQFSEKCVEELLRRNIRFALTIVPVKSSSGSHIKGGITRSLEAQLKAQRTDNRLTPEDATEIEEAIRYFGHTFPKASLPIYARLDFIREVSRDSRGATSSHLRVIDQGVDKGIVKHHWIADNLLRAYLSGVRSISPPLRESFAESMNSCFPK
ncbi:hypothetical protein DSO57_1019446 [Entomophthora muscae]|uniref:Uncharacterized protein n=1 Tax=Entomophthora muscae TaxID=34485 RepID=A0ACC2RV71_9FUNG|nr:hypothetical protein DSO57_1019446 [Entomophthora muscae]